MHNNSYHGWNKALTFGVGSIQLSFRTCKDVFNPNVTAFQSNCAEGLHFSAFHYTCSSFVLRHNYYIEGCFTDEYVGYNKLCIVFKL